MPDYRPKLHKALLDTLEKTQYPKDIIFILEEMGYKKTSIYNAKKQLNIYTRIDDKRIVWSLNNEPIEISEEKQSLEAILAIAFMRQGRLTIDELKQLVLDNKFTMKDAQEILKTYKVKREDNYITVAV